MNRPERSFDIRSNGEIITYIRTLEKYCDELEKENTTLKQKIIDSVFDSCVVIKND